MKRKCSYLLILMDIKFTFSKERALEELKVVLNSFAPLPPPLWVASLPPFLESGLTLMLLCSAGNRDAPPVSGPRPEGGSCHFLSLVRLLSASPEC